MKKSIQQLRRLNFQDSDIRTHPNILLQTDFQLLNNFQRLHEIGFTEVTAYRLVYAEKIMSKSQNFNQSFNFLPKNINIIKNTFAIAKVLFDDEITYSKEMPLEFIHRMALRHYMHMHIQYTTFDIDTIWDRYPKLKKRSLQSIVESVQLLENIYNIPIKQLPKFILTIQPDKIGELIDAGNVSGLDVKTIMTIAPRCNLERLQEIQSICHSYNVPDYAIAFTPDLFTLNVDTLKERLEQIKNMKRGNEFLVHVAIGRLIFAMRRIQKYIKERKKPLNVVLNDAFIE